MKFAGSDWHSKEQFGQESNLVATVASPCWVNCCQWCWWPYLFHMHKGELSMSFVVTDRDGHLINFCCECGFFTAVSCHVLWRWWFRTFFTFTRLTPCSRPGLDLSSTDAACSFIGISLVIMFRLRHQMTGLCYLFNNWGFFCEQCPEIWHLFVFGDFQALEDWAKQLEIPTSKFNVLMCPVRKMIVADGEGWIMKEMSFQAAGLLTGFWNCMDQ